MPGEISRSYKGPDAGTREPLDAVGTIMTQIDCPECDSVFDKEGDVDGETVECPDCSSLLKIRRM
jgi:uncharacterized Zn finger protein (UPF0148 family)